MILATIQDRVSFVEQLVIDRHGTRVMAAAASQPAANVDAGSLMSFAAGVSPQHRSDALNSALLAQLNSDTLFNRFDQTQIINWYQNYTTVLGKIGWTMQGLQFQNYQASGSTFSIDAAIAAICASFLPAAQWAVVKASLDALSNLGTNDPWYTVWDQATHDANGGNFQLASCVDNNGAVDTLVMQLSAYAFHTTQTTTRFLWTNYNSSSTDLHYATQTATLNEGVFSAVRAKIAAKLGTKAADFIGDLSI